MREHAPYYIHDLRAQLEKQLGPITTNTHLRALMREVVGSISEDDYELLRSGLVWQGVLKPLKEIPDVYALFGKEFEPADIICTIDDHAVISHLSAMAHHGLTDRMPRDCFYTDVRSKGARRHARPESYGGARFIRTTTRDEIKFIQLHGSVVRITTVGRTLLDMLRKPVLCGGVNHVLGIFDEQGGVWVNELVAEVNAWGNSIDKVRAGYVLDERLQIDHAVLDEWAQHASRGGSRKLDPQAPYNGQRFSERWCLSLNQA